MNFSEFKKIMSHLEKIEITSIALLTVLIAFFGSYLLQSVKLGQLVLHASVALLVQGLIRDVSILYFDKKSQNTQNPQAAQHEKLQCMCLESSFGILGIILGGVLLFSGIDFSLPMNTILWSSAFLGITVFGFLIKDYIFVWNPFAIKKEKNHQNIIFSWKK